MGKCWKIAGFRGKDETAMARKGDYPCLCQAIGCVLFWGRIAGLLPVVSVGRPGHVCGCKFVVSRGWFIHSCLIQVFYLPYFVVAYGNRLSCGPYKDEVNVPEWYVMTFGYFITDLDTIVALLAGLFLSKRHCHVLEKMSKMAGAISETRRFAKIVTILTISLLAIFCTMFCSFLYVAWLRLGWNIDSYDSCAILDAPLGVILRGCCLIIPTVQCLIISLYGLLVSSKFRNLAETTIFYMDKLSAAHPLDCTASLEAVKSASVYTTHCGRNDMAQRLDQLSDAHQDITYILNQVNECIGIQLLATVSSSLYTTVYYLYRYVTAPGDTTGSNMHERIHYMGGLVHRVAKMAICMILGRMVLNSSLQPLQVLQRSRIINLPTRLQQQVQSLLLQWHNKRGYLSAYGVINVGPWLLAPITGSVITYLLVALQFNGRRSVPLNVTAIMESIF